MSSRALREQLSPRRALQRRTRNGWLTLLSIICLSLCVELAAHLAQVPNHATTRAQTAPKTPIAVQVPHGCDIPDANVQQQATAISRTMALPRDMVPLRVARDANGTLVVMCTATLPQASHDALQHALLAQGWQAASDITATGTMSLTFQHDGVVVFVTIAAQPTTPLTTQVIIILPH